MSVSDAYFILIPSLSFFSPFNGLPSFSHSVGVSLGNEGFIYQSHHIFSIQNHRICGAERDLEIIESSFFSEDTEFLSPIVIITKNSEAFKITLEN